VRDRSPRLSHNVGPGRDASWALCCSVWASSPRLKPPREASPNYPSLLTLMTSWLLDPLTKPLPFSTASPLSLRTWASRFPYPSPLCCGPRPSPRLAPSAPGPPPTPFPFSSAQRLFWALLLALIPRAGSGSLLSVFARTSPSSRLFVIPSSPLKPPSSSYGSVLSPVSFSPAGPYLPVSLLLRAPPSTSSLFARPPPSCGWTLSQYPVKCAFRCPSRCVSEAWDFVLWLLLPPPPSSALSPPPLPTCSLRISRPRPLSLQISSMPSRWFASSPV